MRTRANPYMPGAGGNPYTVRGPAGQPPSPGGTTAPSDANPDDYQYGLADDMGDGMMAQPLTEPRVQPNGAPAPGSSADQPFGQAGSTASRVPLICRACGAQGEVKISTIARVGEDGARLTCRCGSTDLDLDENPPSRRASYGTKTCSSCGGNNHENASVCAHCGKRFPERAWSASRRRAELGEPERTDCPKCGTAAYNPNIGYCSQCGYADVNAEGLIDGEWPASFEKAWHAGRQARVARLLRLAVEDYQLDICWHCGAPLRKEGGGEWRHEISSSGCSRPHPGGEEIWSTGFDPAVDNDRCPTCGTTASRHTASTMSLQDAARAIGLAAGITDESVAEDLAAGNTFEVGGKIYTPDGYGAVWVRPAEVDSEGYWVSSRRQAAHEDDWSGGWADTAPHSRRTAGDPSRAGLDGYEPIGEFSEHPCTTCGKPVRFQTWRTKGGPFITLVAEDPGTSSDNFGVWCAEHSPARYNARRKTAGWAPFINNVGVPPAPRQEWTLDNGDGTVGWVYPFQVHPGETIGWTWSVSRNGRTERSGHHPTEEGAKGMAERAALGGELEHMDDSWLRAAIEEAQSRTGGRRRAFTEDDLDPISQGMAWPNAYEDGYEDGYFWAKGGNPLETAIRDDSSGNTSYRRGINDGYADGAAGNKPRISTPRIDRYGQLSFEQVRAAIVRTNPGLPHSTVVRVARKTLERLAR